MAPPAKFCPGKLKTKHFTRVSKTQVLIESRVLKTRDAIFIHCFQTVQLTILLKYYCYIARVFDACVSLTRFEFDGVYGSRGSVTTGVECFEFSDLSAASSTLISATYSLFWFLMLSEIEGVIGVS